MKSKKRKNKKEEGTGELTQVQSKLTYLEGKLEKIVQKENKMTKSELEKLIEAYNEITINNRLKNKEQTKSKIRVNENYLDKIIKECNEGVFIADENDNIKESNEIIEALLGYKKKELKGMTLKSIIPRVHRLENISRYSDMFTQRMQLFRGVRKYPAVETILFDKGKNALPFRVKTSILRDSNEQTIGSIFLLKDITERRIIKDAIKRENERLEELLETSKRIEIVERLKGDLEENRLYIESIIESSTDGIIVTDISGVVKKVNNALSKLIDYPPHELIGKHISELTSLEDKEYYTTYGDIITVESYWKDALKKVSDLYSTGESYIETYLLRRDGLVVPLGCTMYLIHDKKGQKSEGVGIFKDLTEKKLAERDLRKAYQELREAKEYLDNIISTTADGIIITDPQGAITRVNEAVEEMTGYAQGKMKGMHISKLNHHADDKNIYQSRLSMVDTLFKDGKVKGLESVWKSKSGELISTELNSALLKDKKGEVIGGVVGVRDIGERKKIQEMEMKNAFISNISHEFRTPLTLSTGPLEGLLRGEFGRIGREVKDQIGMALRNNRRQLKLVNQLLEFTRLESGNNNLSYYKKDINQFLSAILDTFTFLAKKKDITLNFTPTEESVPVYIDPGRMERVFFNIIGNAFKFTPKGGTITIEVKTEIENDGEERENGFLQISVKDTGIGIKEEDRQHIFERFKQADGSSSRRYEGTGIGLSLAKELIELQDGKISVESEYKKGSTFTIVLPLGKDHINNQHKINEETTDEIIITQGDIELSDLGYDEVKESEEKPTGKRPLILFIDDNLDVRKYVKGILGTQYDVITAEDGIKGLEKLKHYIPDVIIADIMMPRMDGHEFCKTVKSHPELRYIPLIFLTAKSDTEMKVEGLEEGADDYIIKPFNSKELLARVKSLLRIQELTRENMVKEKKIAELTKFLDEKYCYHNLIGKSKPMQEIYRLLESIKGAESPVLISGETGTGKELIAHAIHYNSMRKSHPFIIIDCSVLNKNLLESELFGHVRGAFTGAVADKKGIFEVADGGTLFLDEIGEMNRNTQIKLLRVLEEGTFRPVGSSKEKKVDARIITATNKDLGMLIKKGKFREDLFYRINVINVTLPSLRERNKDIPLLVDHFIGELNGDNGGKRRVSKEALSRLMEHSYPGNVRELKNIVERAFMLCEKDIICSKDLPLEVRGEIKANQLPSHNRQGIALDHIKNRAEKVAILQALNQVKGNKSKAAKLLNISRSTLYTRIEKYQKEC